MSVKIVLALLASVLAGACSVTAQPPGGAVIRGQTLVAEAPEASMIAIAARGSARVRVLYVRNGSMALIREVALPVGESVDGLALSADGADLVIDTRGTTHELSTRLWGQQARRMVAVGPGIGSAGRAY